MLGLFSKILAKPQQDPLQEFLDLLIPQLKLWQQSSQCELVPDLAGLLSGEKAFGFFGSEAPAVYEIPLDSDGLPKVLKEACPFISKSFLNRYAQMTVDPETKFNKLFEDLYMIAVLRVITHPSFDVDNPEPVTLNGSDSMTVNFDKDTLKWHVSFRKGNSNPQSLSTYFLSFREGDFGAHQFSLGNVFYLEEAHTDLGIPIGSDVDLSFQMGTCSYEVTAPFSDKPTEIFPELKPEVPDVSTPEAPYSYQDRVQEEVDWHAIQNARTKLNGTPRSEAKKLITRIQRVETKAKAGTLTHKEFYDDAINRLRLLVILVANLRGKKSSELPESVDKLLPPFLKPILTQDWKTKVTWLQETALDAMEKLTIMSHLAKSGVAIEPLVQHKRVSGAMKPDDFSNSSHLPMPRLLPAELESLKRAGQLTLGYKVLGDGQDVESVVTFTNSKGFGPVYGEGATSKVKDGDVSAGMVLGKQTGTMFDYSYFDERRSETVRLGYWKDFYAAKFKMPSQELKYALEDARSALMVSQVVHDQGGAPDSLMVQDPVVYFYFAATGQPKTCMQQEALKPGFDGLQSDDERSDQESPLVTEDQMMWCLNDVSEALTYLHQKGVVHRDVKPWNILRGQDDRYYKLIDFNVACQVKDAKKSVLGTVGFMPGKHFKSVQDESVSLVLTMMYLSAPKFFDESVRLSQRFGEENLGDRSRMRQLRAVFENFKMHTKGGSRMNSELLELMERCLCDNHKDRPHPSEFQSLECVKTAVAKRTQESSAVQDDLEVLSYRTTDIDVRLSRNSYRTKGSRLKDIVTQMNCLSRLIELQPDNVSHVEKLIQRYKDFKAQNPRATRAVKSEITTKLTMLQSRLRFINSTGSDC